MRKAINPANEELRIESLKKTRNGGVIVLCD